MDTTFLSYLEGQFGALCVTSLADESIHAALAAREVPSLFRNYARGCREEPHVWEGALVRGASQEVVEAVVDEFFRRIGLSSRDQLGEGRPGKFFDPTGTGAVGAHGYWCWMGRELDGVYVVTQSDCAEWRGGA